MTIVPSRFLRHDYMFSKPALRMTDVTRAVSTRGRDEDRNNYPMFIALRFLKCMTSSCRETAGTIHLFQVFQQAINFIL